jgi:hypothetical protein
MTSLCPQKACTRVDYLQNPRLETRGVKSAVVIIKGSILVVCTNICIRKVRYSGLQRRVLCRESSKCESYTLLPSSEQNTTPSKKPAKSAGKLSLLSDHEDEGDMFLRNARTFPNDTALQPGTGKQKGLWNLNYWQRQGGASVVFVLGSGQQKGNEGVQTGPQKYR